jgi:hypothetical protein
MRLKLNPKATVIVAMLYQARHKNKRRDSLIWNDVSCMSKVTLPQDTKPRKAVALMRERLIELIRTFCKREDVLLFNRKVLDKFADYLFEDGWIRPTCKVGDVVYVVDKGLDVWWKGEVSSVGYVDLNNIQIGVIYDDGEVAICDADIVFLTKEEAEAALKGGAE